MTSVISVILMNIIYSRVTEYRIPMSLEVSRRKQPASCHREGKGP